jgi:hypothetical protein
MVGAKPDHDTQALPRHGNTGHDLEDLGRPSASVAEIYRV